ncbi:alpha/beta fold hydrolase [Muricoccus radiodurans]|uniref:alpha/beta fold hydrolase n=1 Tax=Muricoccus radiodurans TaxID=2231721 RepID=UPI003CF73917
MASPDEPRPGHLRCDLGTVAATLRWVEWGPVDGAPVICVHGLTRTGRDFDALAAVLADQGRRVICPDVFGRGFSDWLPDPALYSVPVYAMAFQQLLRGLGRDCDWVGTSMGGLIGMAVAGGEHAPRRIVLNDVGPFIPASALRRIAAYLALRPVFRDLEELEAHLRLIHAPFGILSDAEWRHLAQTSARRTPEGGVVQHYDPAIAAPMLGNPIEDVDLWRLWESLAQPVLVLRGAESDLLDATTAAAMGARDGVEVLTVPRCGHAPALTDPAQTGAVAGFLRL